MTPDDDLATRLEAALGTEGRKVTRVPTHAEGLSQAKALAPDVVIYGSSGEGADPEGFRSALESRLENRSIPVLPVASDETPERVAAAIRRLAERADEEEEDDGVRTILIVDDKDANRRRLASQFAGSSWKVLEAMDGKGTALLLIDHAIDCVIVNALLAGKTSHGIVRSAAEIRKVHPHPYSILVIADAEHSDTASRMIENGADDVVGRSSGAFLLHRRVQCVLKLRDLLRENRTLKERLAATLPSEPV
ncbi:MAG: hypothetical protein DHS20C21_23620 [Gemmatimonadota bacterium]|nr:MAG: hypothetical protein DHS20C21_23620 [Gemmatimonadota bacterium]